MSETASTPMPTSAHVSLRGVARVYSGGALQRSVHGLGPIDLDLRGGEFFAIVGSSGCGQSTLLDLIGGLVGEITGRLWRALREESLKAMGKQAGVG